MKVPKKKREGQNKTKYLVLDCLKTVVRFGLREEARVAAVIAVIRLVWMVMLNKERMEGYAQGNERRGKKMSTKELSRRDCCPFHFADNAYFLFFLCLNWRIFGAMAETF